MKTYLVLFLLLFLQVNANAESVEKGKQCILSKIMYAKATMLPPELRLCGTPVRLVPASAPEGEEAESCVTEGDKDKCKVYVACRSQDESQDVRFSIEAKVKYNGYLASFVLPDCQLSEISAVELGQH